MNKKILLPVILLFILSNCTALEIYNSDSFNYNYKTEDLHEQEGWDVSWAGCEEEKRIARVIMSSESCDGLREVELGCNENREFTVMAKRKIDTTGYENLVLAYNPRTENDGLMEVRWRNNIEDGWKTVWSAKDESLCQKEPRQSKIKAKGSPDFEISIKYTGNEKTDRAFFDEIILKGCKKDSQACWNSDECCGPYCCPDGKGNTVCSSIPCCSGGGQNCPSVPCCSNMKCDIGDTQGCFVCSKCSEDSKEKLCSSQEAGECEWECGAAKVCDNMQVNETITDGALCSSCLNCQVNTDEDIGGGLCECEPGTCEEGYCLEGTTYYYGVKCSPEGWTYNNSCDVSKECTKCPGPKCYETEPDPVENKTEQVTNKTKEKPGGMLEELMKSVGATTKDLDQDSALLLIIVLASIGIVAYMAYAAVKYKTRKPKKTKKERNQDRIQELKDKRRKLEEEGKNKKEIDKINKELLENDEYLASLYKEAKTAAKEYSQGKSKEQIKKELEEKGYTDKELKLIRKIFTKETVKTGKFEYDLTDDDEIEE